MKKCFFCGGNIIDDETPHCLKCGRSADVEYELKVKELQAKEHQNWHSYHGLSAGKIGRKANNGMSNNIDLKNRRGM